MKKLITIMLLLLLLPTTHSKLATVHAIVDPLSVPNNRFGIHIISATPDESSPAAALVNSSGGQWGYVTVLIQSNDRSRDKWQAFFDDLRRRHLIPLVRIATKPLNEHWERPYEGEEEAWADFLDSLNWPVKNRYVIIYNEPNHGKEWGNFVDPKNYAEVLDQTITELKTKNRDFFVLNGGLDASAPHQPPNYYDQVRFMQEMNQTVPGIFNKLDGWVSHSYPNPAFVGSPHASGRGTVRTWLWEKELLRSFGVRGNLPIFITETGWKHAEGLVYDPNLPATETVASYFRQAFQTAWNNNQIVAVTPFLLNYQDFPFDHFSFKKITGEDQKQKILGVQYPDYYPSFDEIAGMPKIAGKPIVENRSELISKNWPEITFKNIGQSIWNDMEPVRLIIQHRISGQEIESLELPLDIKIEPGEKYSFESKVTASENGIIRLRMNLYTGEQEFDSEFVYHTLFTFDFGKEEIYNHSAKLK